MNTLYAKTILETLINRNGWRLIVGMLRPPVTFDFGQHWRDWYRWMLPLVVLVAAVGIILMVGLSRQGDKSAQETESAARLSLIAASAEAIYDPAFAVVSPLEMVKTPRVPTFDAPVGTRHAGLTYNAQPFFTNRHLGDDINGIGGKNSDLGDPVYAVADGQVIYAGWASEGWGNVVILLHEQPNGEMLESFYGHLDQIKVPVGGRIMRGQKVGTIGSANGLYWAHLHFELRHYPTLDVGVGYAETRLGRYSGELMLKKWRTQNDDQLALPTSGARPEPKPLRVEAEDGDSDK